MDSIYLNALNIVFGLTRIRKLLKTFKTAERAWRAPVGKILRLDFDGIGIREALEKRETTDPKAEWAKLEKLNIKTISFFEKSYPKLLKETGSPPTLLYLKGCADLLKEKCLAVVGTRTPSSYGRAAVEMLVPKIAAAGLTVVSGLAQGVDALTHLATLKAGGKTIGVLGCGLDQIYPKMNEPIAKEMLAKNNLIVSEYPVGTPALRQNFPARNRIIAGLSLGTLVIESKADGGALITAKQALEANREVFALPGPITYPTAAGTNKLIQEGAKVILTAEDILQELNLKVLTGEEKIKVNLDKLSADEKNMVSLIQKEPAHIDKIIQITKLKPHVVSSTLTGLELKGFIKNTGGQIYTLL
ncbi:MAG: DNA-protecting protein DprA [Candidatus Sungbacteria bacterium]|uniref:DNA-protecting protein DprA n=1 Tax=Candidatus Sungiibacteriota bacterium TaxID=2750080 RepID=A0A932DSJ0_9BACT|nr:DNA-protecting protein DprA [Candidatus Sungbacteria bacterium]MBI2465957.1 DNA-protecting protein DprA [Candidatus Sungbacteria bacterium]